MKKIAVVGLGYVGLPLLVKLSEFYNVLGFDIDQSRISELKKGNDRTGEINNSNLLLSDSIFYSFDEDLRNNDVYIVTVPTPVDTANHPDLNIIKDVCWLDVIWKIIL